MSMQAMGNVLRPAGLAVLAALSYLLPGIFGGGAPVYSAGVLIAIFAVMAYGLDLIVSDLGEVSLAHPVFFAAGSYTTALLATGAHASAWMTLAGSVGVALALAALMALVTLKLRQFVFSLVTYAVVVVAQTLAANWSFLGGSDGIRGIPVLELSVAGLQWRAVDDRQLWPVAFALLAGTLYVVARFRKSRLGVAAIVTHLNPRLAIVNGIDPGKVRLQVFMLSAPISAAAGWLYAYERSFVGADVLESYFLILMLTAVVLVGRRQLFGPLAAVALIQIQEKFFSFGGDFDRIVLGAVLVAVLAFYPQGLAALFAPVWRAPGGRTAGRHAGGTSEAG
jgi:branched-chain amino acid transport system permease protein